MALQSDSPNSKSNSNCACDDTKSQGQYEIRLGQIFPLLIDAAANSRAWLNDFSDEPVAVSEDLYDVILAYQHFQEI